MDGPVGGFIGRWGLPWVARMRAGCKVGDREVRIVAVVVERERGRERLAEL